MHIIDADSSPRQQKKQIQGFVGEKGKIRCRARERLILVDSFFHVNFGVFARLPGYLDYLKPKLLLLILGLSCFISAKLVGDDQLVRSLAVRHQFTVNQFRFCDTASQVYLGLAEIANP